MTNPASLSNITATGSARELAHYPLAAQGQIRADLDQCGKRYVAILFAGSASPCGAGAGALQPCTYHHASVMIFGRRFIGVESRLGRQWAAVRRMPLGSGGLVRMIGYR